jgi:hypothetical protein
LKNYKNCKFKPLIACDDKNTPILYLILPPPLHLILLGPVNHIISSLKEKYPMLVKVLDVLHIQRSKYHGKNLRAISVVKYCKI